MIIIAFEEFSEVCRHRADYIGDLPISICRFNTYVPNSTKRVLCNEENCPFVNTKSIQETYLMGYQCFNCGHTFNREIPKGVLAIGKAGECPKCGIKELDDTYEIHTPTHAEV